MSLPLKLGLASVLLVAFTSLPPTPAVAEQASEWLTQPDDGITLELSTSAELPTPSDVLGYRLGDRFTQHHAILDYLDQLAAASPRVEIEDYGRTYEDRPLRLVVVTSEANQRRLDGLRRQHQRVAAGALPIGDDLDLQLPAVVWLAFGVHGDETSSAEAAMAAAYALAAAAPDSPWGRALASTIVIIDPLVNPDGRERWVVWYQSQIGRRADPDPQTIEHQPPWPGGRQNHYLIDLNRDWAWLSQQETRQRLAAYRQWEPHVYVDFHEMESSSTYFFPPAADPIHPEIEPVAWWLDIFGRANANAFDERGWTYFVREVFDLYYPGYGDSYPALRGAVGMTYEMAGSGSSGSLVERSDGTMLTLADRIVRHLTSALTTVATASEHRSELVDDFARRRADDGSAATYLWRADQPEARALAALLEAHGFDVGRLPAASTLWVSPLTMDQTVERKLSAGTYVVTARRPLAPLLRTLMDARLELSESFIDGQSRRLEDGLDVEIYDVTAWSLPLAFNVEAWRIDELLDLDLATDRDARAISINTERARLGYMVPFQGLASYQLLADLQRRGWRMRLATKRLSDDKATPRGGDLFVPRRGNPDDFDQVLGELAQRLAVDIDPIASSWNERGGPALGSSSMRAVRPSRIGLVGGRSVSATSHGFAWHLLDQQLQAGFSRLDVDQLADVELDDFDVLVLPDGDYEQTLTRSGGKEVEAWVRAGGILVAIGDAVDWCKEHDLAEDLERWRPVDKASAAAGDDGETTTSSEPNSSVANPWSRQITIPGAAVATRLGRHPLTAGLAKPPPALLRGDVVWLPTGNPRQDLLTVRSSQPVLAGLVWPQVEPRIKGSLLVATRAVGDGHAVLFTQEPAFRLFWRGTMPLFLNATLLGPTLLDDH